VFLGQSRRFDDKDNPFNPGSGLSEQDSDYVGQVTTRIGPYLNLDYRLQLDNEDLSSRRHEVEAVSQLDRLSLGARYFYAAAIQGTDLDETREQLRPYARFRFYDEWYVSGALRYDFAESERGLRSASYGIDYQGQCMTFALTAERTLTSEATGDSDTEIMLRVGLKNLGEFESSGISIGGGDNDDRRSEGLTNN
jgi:LPS-assembly protein